MTIPHPLRSGPRRAASARTSRRPTLLLGLLAAISSELPGASTATAQDRDVIAAFADRIATDVAADDVGGITAAVFRGDHVLWAQGFGWADPARRIPAGVRTIYRTGSISKSVTAVLLADLVEEGLLDLDDPVEDALPEMSLLGDPPAGMGAVTYRQLASHTAGLIREPELDGAAAGPIEDWGHKILASIPRTRFYTMPGTQYQYSNIGFGILGYAVQRAAGSSFIDLVNDRIFRPLGMTSSTFVVEPGLARRLSVGFANGGDGPPDPDFPALEHAGRGYKVPNGGVYATVGDLATFGAAVMGRTEFELLEAPTREIVMTRHTPPDGPGYGLGFSINAVTLPGGTSVDLVGHGGSVAGYNAYLVFEPESGYGVVMLRNYNRGETNLGRASVELLTALLAAEKM
ncbi:MAG: beta-lactamase family protein [Gemmatimonadetes bacterium]|nr:beta-lactamase family protein [Gemmatimonadota bacterium]